MRLAESAIHYLCEVGNSYTRFKRMKTVSNLLSRVAAVRLIFNRRNRDISRLQRLMAVKYRG